MFLHHAVDDGTVRFEGCCASMMGGDERCCCGISQKSNQCTSAEMFFNRWAKEVNGCDEGQRQKPAKGQVAVMGLVKELPEGQYTCSSAHSCRASTVRGNATDS